MIVMNVRPLLFPLLFSLLCSFKIYKIQFSKPFKIIYLSLIILSFSFYSSAQTTISLSLVASDLSQPVDIKHAGDERIFIVEKTGRIKLFENNSLRPEAVLDLSHKVSSYSERGLLALAFAPDFTETNHFYVNYNNQAGNNIISRFTLDNNTTLADINSEEIILEIAQPFAWHNVGQIAFGADGYLYIASGDGGAANDPFNTAQNLQSLLGKILRIDVSAKGTNKDINKDIRPYTIPSDNPFIDTKNALPEIWSYGLRNPWRISFDTLTGDLYIADVGQNAFEELNFQASTSTGGENYGWSIMEAKSCTDLKDDCKADSVFDTLVNPIIHYAHSFENGQSIIGGYVYRGTLLTGLARSYIYGDFVSGNIWQAIPDPNGIRGWRNKLLLDTALNISTFGVDANLELYVASFSGDVYKIIRE